MTNAYPEKAIVPYQRTSVAMADVVRYLQGVDCLTNIKRCVYVIFRNESANGKSGVNNNYGGFQADSGRWPSFFDAFITGIVDLDENKTGRQRLFLAFEKWQVSVDLLLNRIKDRGIYIGARNIKNLQELMEAYYKHWVKGDDTAIMPNDEQDSFAGMYTQAISLFPDTVPAAQTTGVDTMPIATILGLTQALIALVPQAEAAAPVVQKLLNGQDPTTEEIATLEAVTQALNNQAAAAEAAAGAAGPTE